MIFTGKRIWITGASSGIGEALARELAQRGALLILSARRGEVLESVRGQLPNADKHRVVTLDLGKPESLGEVVKKELQAIGAVDILINNGGVSQRSTVAETSLHVIRQLIDINYLGTVAMTKALLPSMIQQGKGMIVAVSSVLGKIGAQTRGGYCGSKHAVNGFMDSLRAEVWRQGIRVLVACPGFVSTQVSVNALNGQGEKYGKLDAEVKNGISAERCAHEIVQGMVKGKEELVIGKGISRWAPTLKRFFPGTVNRLLRNIIR